MVEELAQDLAASGHNVTILTGWPNHPQGVLFPGWRKRFRDVRRVSPGLTLIRCGHSIHSRQRMFWRMWYYLTFAISTFVNGMWAGKLDAVLCLSTPIFGSWSAYALARIKRARFVYDVFDLHPEAARNAGLIREGVAFRILRKLDTALCRRSDAIVTLSESLRTSLIARRLDPLSIEVIPFWIDENKVKPGTRDNPWRRRHEISTDLFVCLYAGTIGYVSGAMILVQTARLLQARPDVLILVVGEGPLKEELERQVSTVGLRNVRFLPFQPASELSDMQASANVGLVTLLPDAGASSIPSKVLGYLAAGRAVVASVAADSGTATMLKEGQCGVVVPSHDAAALAEAIMSAADRPEAVVQMGQNGRDYLLRKFSRRTCTALYEQVMMGSACQPVAGRSRT